MVADFNMDIISFLKDQVERDPLIRFFKRIFLNKFSTPQEEALWHYRQARIHLNYRNNKFDMKLAIFHLKEALRIMPGNKYFHFEFGRALLLAASFAVVTGDDGELALSRGAEISIKSFEKALSLDPYFSPAYHHLALAFEYVGQKEKAKEICETAIDKLPSGNPRSFLESYLKLLEGPPPDRETIIKLEQESLIHLQQAVAYQQQGRRKAAIKEFEKGCQLAPNSTWLYRTLCKLSSRKQDSNLTYNI